jgi:DNA polymerase
MPDPVRPDRDQLARLARQHLESLRAAGVEWLPAAPISAPPPVEASDVPRTSGINPEAREPRSLFADAEAGAAAAVPVEERCRALEVVAARVAKCTRCPQLVANRSQTVFGVGRMDPEICFIGEAPGAEEDAQGEPFVGPAGQLLNRIIGACGMKREDVYICNILRCRPPGNRLPLSDEASNCREYLDETLSLVRPKYICCLGACAAQNLLGTTLSIGKLRGTFRDYRGIPVMCTYHPAYLLRSPDRKREVWEDMKKLLARMGRPIPRP